MLINTTKMQTTMQNSSIKDLIEEPDDNDKLYVGVIKELTGGDRYIPFKNNNF